MSLLGVDFGLEGLIAVAIPILYMLGMVKDVFGKKETEDDGDVIVLGDEHESEETTVTPAPTRRAEPPRPPRSPSTADLPPVPTPARPTSQESFPTLADRPGRAPQPARPVPQPIRPAPQPARPAPKPVARPAEGPPRVKRAPQPQQTGPAKRKRKPAAARQESPTPKKARVQRRRRRHLTEAEKIMRILRSPRGVQAALQMNEILDKPVALRRDHLER